MSSESSQRLSSKEQYQQLLDDHDHWLFDCDVLHLSSSHS